MRGARRRFRDGVPSSRVQPSPRTCRTISVTTRAPPPVSTPTRASARCWPSDGHLPTVRELWSPAGACLPRCAGHLRVDRAHQHRCGLGWVAEPAGDHAVGVEAPFQCRRRPLALLSGVVGLASVAPPSQLDRQLGGREPLGDGAQFVLIVRVGEPGQRLDLAVGQPPIGETARDFVDNGQGVADTQPLAAPCTARCRRAPRPNARNWARCRRPTHRPGRNRRATR